MQLSLSFIRLLFLGLCLLFAITFSTKESPQNSYYINLIVGAISGLTFWCVIISLDSVFKRFNLRAFNVAALGLLFGYLMGEAILLILQTVLDISLGSASPTTLGLLRMTVFLFSAYFGMVMTARASDEIYLSIPFIRFKQNTHKNKDLLLDSAALLDPRVIDLATSGLLDHHLVVPRFLIKELNEQVDNADENIRLRARRCIDTVKKLESISTLDLRFADSDFNDLKDPMVKLLRIARLLDANILTGDATRIQQPSIEGIRLINIHSLSNALKPLAQTGEFINIKIQRYGKEPRQGVGYLDDGTMVVVNGGAEFIGETIRAQVLSAKHTVSGRMIFCNALEDPLFMESNMAVSVPCCETEPTPKNYFAL